MTELLLFCEDEFHERFTRPLVHRVAREMKRPVAIRTRSARGGLSRMPSELRQLLHEIRTSRHSRPGGILVVADANCKGYNGRKALFDPVIQKFEEYRSLVIHGIPEPHIERWMLIDPDAFRSVFGRGCTLPKTKCQKDEYKKLLRSEIRDSGIEPPLGGMEYAEDIVAAMNLARAEKSESSFAHLLRDVRAMLRTQSR